jgi:hypothetical protein
MAKFYFHLRDRTDQLLDPEGLDCPSASAVATKALAAARHIISHDAAAGAIDLRYRIDVEDSSDTIVHSMEFEDAVSIADVQLRASSIHQFNPLIFGA